MREFGPKSPIGSIINVVICSALTVGAVIMGVTQNSFGFFVAGVGALMLMYFVWTAVKVNRSR